MRHINDNLSDFSSSGDSDEEQIEAIWLVFFGNIFFEGAISKMPFFFNTWFITFEAFSIKDF